MSDIDRDRLPSGWGRPAYVPGPASEILAALKKRRKELKVSLEELALRLGTSSSVVSGWERNVHHPSVERLSLWAEALRVRIVLEEIPWEEEEPDYGAGAVDLPSEDVRTLWGS